MSSGIMEAAIQSMYERPDDRWELLKEAKQYYDDNDKSTEFMLQYMQDVANVDLAFVLKFIEDEGRRNPPDPPEKRR